MLHTHMSVKQGRIAFLDFDVINHMSVKQGRIAFLDFDVI